MKIKPLSDKKGSGFNLLGVETYGGGLWHTWFDRDLAVAGRAYVRTSPATIESHLVRLDEALIRVPSLAVHLDRQNPFKFSTENQLLPVTSQTAEAIPVEHSHDHTPRLIGPWKYEQSPADRRHHDLLIHKLAAQLNTHPSNIVDVDLSLYDTQKATLGGLNSEFIYSARIDNLMMSFCALKSFTASLDSPTALDKETSVRTLVMFDHEEIGSEGPIGAKSTFLPRTLQRISAIRLPESHHLSNFKADEKGGRTSKMIIIDTPYEQAIARSFLISADVHHGKHPNYSGYHEANHTPFLNNGIVFASTSRKYLGKSTPGTIMMVELTCHPERSSPASDSTSDQRGDGDVQNVAIRQPPKSQTFVSPNGGDCGSTVGPHLEANLGINVVDMGNPVISMHSIREMAGSHDVDNAVRVFRLFYEYYSEYEGLVVCK